MRTIILYGALAEKFGKYHRFAVKNPSEAIRALRANHREFEAYMCGAHRENIGFQIFVGGSGLRNYDQVKNPAGERDVIRIVPRIFGSGSGWTKILVGAVLVVAGAVISAASFGGATPIGGALISMGAGLIIGGVSQLLTRPPDVPGTSQQDMKKSYLFSGPQNVSAQGNPVPVGYGRMVVGSVIISAGIETSDG